MNKDLAFVAILSITGIAASVGVVVTAEIEFQPDLVAIEALDVSKPIVVSARNYLKRASGVRRRMSDESTLAGN